MPFDHRATRQVLEAALGEAVDGDLTDRCFQQIERAWPTLKVDGSSFGRALAASSRTEGLRFDQLAVADLFLVHACLANVPEALTALDDLLGDVTEVLMRQTTPDMASEAVQLLRARLLVSSGSHRASLSAYSGRGPLFGFLRASAVNSLRNLQSGATRWQTEGDDALAQLPDTADLEASMVRADMQAHFREAFRAAVKSLTVRQRGLLRFNLIDGLTIDEIAPLYSVHRSSLARWLAEARETLAHQTRSLLAERLKLPANEVEAMLASVQNHFDLSLSRVLRESQSAAQVGQQA